MRDNVHINKNRIIFFSTLIFNNFFFIFFNNDDLKNQEIQTQGTQDAINM